MEPLRIQLDHDKVNLAFFTDVHAAAKAPGRRKSTYGEEILSKLRWTAELTRTVKGAGICGGDLFHVKNSESKSNVTGYVTQVMGALQMFPQGCVYGIVGNHDITGDSMTTLADQPLGNLMQSGTYHDLGTSPCSSRPRTAPACWSRPSTTCRGMSSWRRFWRVAKRSTTR